MTRSGAANLRRVAVVVLPALAAGILLRLFRLGGEGLWCDEGFTAHTVAKPIGSLLRDLARYDDAPPLYYLLTKGVVHVFGDSEAALRLFSAVAGILTLLFLIRRALRGRNAALLWGAGFVAIAPYAIFYARQARDYAWILLLSFVFVLSARDLLRERTRGAASALALSGAALCLSHNISILLIAASAVLFPLRQRRDLRLRSWLLWHGLAVLPWAIWVALSGGRQLATHTAGNFWILEFWRRHSLLLAPLQSLSAFTPGLAPGATRQVEFPSLAAGQVLWRFLSTAAVILCLVLAFTRRRAPRAARVAGEPAPRPAPFAREILVDGALLAAPLLALLLASLVSSPVYVIGRTDAIAFAPFALLLGRGLARLPRAAAAALLVFWAAISVPALAPTYGLGPPGRAKGSDRAVAEELVGAGLAPGDVLVHGALTSPSLEYYLQRLSARHTAAWFPPGAGLNPACPIAAAPDSFDSYREQARNLRLWMDARVPAEGHAWVLGVIRPEDRAALAKAATGTPAEIGAQEIGYPTNLLVYHLIGARRAAPRMVFRLDWLSGDRVALRIPRRDWVPLDSLPPVVSPAGG